MWLADGGYGRSTGPDHGRCLHALVKVEASAGRILASQAGLREMAKGEGRNPSSFRRVNSGTSLCQNRALFVKRFLWDEPDALWNIPPWRVVTRRHAHQHGLSLLPNLRVKLRDPMEEGTIGATLSRLTSIAR
ncbi:uncharacterized protein A4U43_C05F7120 [Asparagus officinalis]|uniref:Uncharacterized protein n=1 Tax=Asparagus officinalis TaxID=4686 RepID=A0A5P1EPX6_ASPOF|nr:uncharacterized protein A4U43_C05F7120 [Asparagus officinalis]